MVYKEKRGMEMTKAYCYATGLIEFGKECPPGAIAIATGPDQVLRDFIEAVARHGYSTEVINGRPMKIAGTDTLLVPGVPEAKQGSQQAIDALIGFSTWIRKQAPKGVKVY